MAGGGVRVMMGGMCAAENYIGAEGAKALGDALRENSSVTTLHLGGEWDGDESGGGHGVCRSEVVGAWVGMWGTEAWWWVGMVWRGGM